MDKFSKFISDNLVKQVKQLGVVGTISYIGALMLFVVTIQINFQKDFAKGVLLAGLGTILLVYSGFIYLTKSREKAELVKKALDVLGQVYNRMAEQISTSDKDKTVSITMTIDNLPEKISEVIKKSTDKDIF